MDAMEMRKERNPDEPVTAARLATGKQTISRLRTIREVAELCRVSVRTVRRWIDDDDLVVHRLGRRVLVAEEDLQAFLAARREIGSKDVARSCQ
jgi:excisionase family DNA binding protein